MYNVPKTISLTILLKEELFEIYLERKAYVLPHVCTKMIDCRKIDVEEKKSESESERTEGKEITNRGTRSFYDAGKLLRKVLFKFRTPSSFIFKLYPFAFVLSKLHAHSFLYTYIFTLQRSLVST